ncbi:MAG: SLBB domain-containing protein [Sedimentisphaerales bacterium]|nr:SLBB domain-containing protein [Sedimentisphaerales bacterium]
MILTGIFLSHGCNRSRLSTKPAWKDRASGQKKSNSGDFHFTAAQRLDEFDNASPIQPIVDIPEIMRAKQKTGIYRIVPGDLIEFQMPAILRVVTPDLTNSLGQVEPYQIRVNTSGTIILPIIGEIVVAGKSMAQIEEDITQAYYPKYVISPPSVVGRILEYREARITILGAVNRPGTYTCRSDEMTLVDVLMKAEGIPPEGAASIRIHRTENAGGLITNPVVLPVKGLNIPFVNIALKDGDTVEVERLDPQVFTVIGLVKRNGVFPYPPGTTYNLLEALAFAGGVDEFADPPYARIYRQRQDGKIISASVRLRGVTKYDAARLIIKPGDVVAVEHTFSTYTRLMFAKVFRLNFGVNAFYNSNLNLD